MITITNEVTIDVGDLHEQTITFWVVSYGPPPSKGEPDHLPVVLHALRRFCASRGWLLECENDDSYRNKNPNVFSEGYLLPPSDDDAI